MPFVIERVYRASHTKTDPPCWRACEGVAVQVFVVPPPERRPSLRQLVSRRTGRRAPPTAPLRFRPPRARSSPVSLVRSSHAHVYRPLCPPTPTRATAPPLDDPFSLLAPASTPPHPSPRPFSPPPAAALSRSSRSRPLSRESRVCEQRGVGLWNEAVLEEELAGERMN